MPKQQPDRYTASSLMIAVAILIASLVTPASVKADGTGQNGGTQDQIDRNQAVQVFNTFRRPRKATDNHHQH